MPPVNRKLSKKEQFEQAAKLAQEMKEREDAPERQDKNNDQSPTEELVEAPDIPDDSPKTETDERRNLPQLQSQHSEDVSDAPLPVPKIYCKGSQYGPLTAALMIKVLGWENEEDYKEEQKRKNPDAPPESFKFVTEEAISKGKAKGPPVHVLLVDNKGRKVRCKKNDNNRPFDENHCKKLCQEILTRRWAGPTTMPGQTINGENIITSWPIKIPEYDAPQSIVINGQHTGCALILAYQMWLDEIEQLEKTGSNEDVVARWTNYWPPDKYPDGPVIDKSVMTGVSPEYRVVTTLDNVKPRSLSDTIYTSEIFASRPESEKKEASRMLSAAIDFLWARLRVGGSQDGFLKKMYQTHATSHDWLGRHQKLLKCVEHLFVENRGRSITKVKLSSGEAAAVMYLMASSNSDADEYYAQEEPSEKSLNWELWDKAAQFWSKVADASVDDKGVAKDKEAGAIRKALSTVIEPETEDSEGNAVKVEVKAGGKRTAKMVVLSKAWALFKEGKQITQSDILPRYSTVDYKPVFNDEGKAVESVPSVVTLDDESHFGGIDLGDVGGNDRSAGVKALPEEVKSSARTALEVASEKVRNDAIAVSSGPRTPSEWYARAKSVHGKDRILLRIPKGGKRLVAYGEDADILGEELDCSVAHVNGIKMTHQSVEDCDDIVRQLNSAGYQVAVIHELSEVEEKATYFNPTRRKLPKITPNPSKEDVPGQM